MGLSLSPLNNLKQVTWGKQYLIICDKHAPTKQKDIRGLNIKRIY